MIHWDFQGVYLVFSSENKFKKNEFFDSKNLKPEFSITSPIAKTWTWKYHVICFIYNKKVDNVSLDLKPKKKEEEERQCM